MQSCCSEEDHIEYCIIPIPSSNLSHNAASLSLTKPPQGGTISQATQQESKVTVQLTRLLRQAYRSVREPMVIIRFVPTAEATGVEYLKIDK